MNTQRKLRTLLVDDEALSRRGLQLRLALANDVEIIGECSNGREALSAIREHRPDLVFLDIQMPGFDGFSVVQGLMEVEPPLFVFVTAYSEHAIRAFEAQAMDYLLKPVEETRLADTIDRVRRRLTEKRGVEEVEKLKEVLTEVAPLVKPSESLTLSSSVPPVLIVTAPRMPPAPPPVLIFSLPPLMIVPPV